MHCSSKSPAKPQKNNQSNKITYPSLFGEPIQEERFGCKIQSPVSFGHQSAFQKTWKGLSWYFVRPQQLLASSESWPHPWWPRFGTWFRGCQLCSQLCNFQKDILVHVRPWNFRLKLKVTLINYVSMNQLHSTELFFSIFEFERQDIAGYCKHTFCFHFSS